MIQVVSNQTNTIMLKQSIFIHQASIALTNARRSAEIFQALTKHGADEWLIKQLEAQLRNVEKLENQYNDTTAEAKGTTQSLYAVREQGNKLYAQHVLLARVAFKDQPTWLEKMELVGPREKSLPAWIRQTSSFYRHAPAVKDTLVAFQIPTKEIAEMQKLLNRMMELRTLQVDLKGRAQVISGQKKRAYATLRQDMDRFFRIARIALDAAPQHLEMLGLPVKASV